MNKPYHMYLSISGEEKISQYQVDPFSGQMEFVQHVKVAGKPAPLAISPDRRFLYVGNRGPLEIIAFNIDQSTGHLEHIATIPLDADPNFLSTDRLGHYLFSSYYQDGKAAVHEIADSGALNATPVEWLNTATGAHSIQSDRSNRFVFVPHIADRGPNAIFQFQFDEKTGKLCGNAPPRISPSDYLGPRHCCFHPTKNILYCSNEQGGSASVYNLNSTTGTLTLVQTISTLPDSYSGENLCSQIQISPDGRSLYVANRGHNSICCFSISHQTGHLTVVGQAPTEPIPRAFSLDPSGDFLFVAGLESGRLASYKIGHTGAPEPIAVKDVGAAPMWVLITELSP